MYNVMRFRGDSFADSARRRLGALQRESLAALAPAAMFALWAHSALAQRPSIPPQAIPGPELRVAAIAQIDAIDWPAGVEEGQIASVTIDESGHVFVLNRGPQALLEFDGKGRFVRSFADGLFDHFACRFSHEFGAAEHTGNRLRGSACEPCDILHFYAGARGSPVARLLRGLFPHQYSLPPACACLACTMNTEAASTILH